MRITRQLLSASSLDHATALSIGNFDGVHLGHTTILNDLVKNAHVNGWIPTVMTFEPHPKAFFSAQTGQLPPTKILPLRNKLALLKAHGIEHTIVLPFNSSIAQMHAIDFVEKLLLGKLNMKYLLIGDDFRFGTRRTGDFALLDSMSHSHHFSLKAHESIQMGNDRVSSSTIREALTQGKLDTAKKLLGHPLILSGHVIYGQQLGRTIGCPTINIKMPKNITTQGIYAVTVEINHVTYQGVASIGTRPSVKTNGDCWLEVHILDFDDNVYGALAHITLWHKIRPELKFDNLSTLKAAIAQDISDTRMFFAHNLS